MNLIFHLGAPRTGSTTIQNTLKQKYAKDCTTDFELIRERDSAISMHLDFYKYYWDSKFLGHFMAGAGEMFLAVREDSATKNLILSEENLAGDMLGKSNFLFNRLHLAFTTIKRFSRCHNCSIIVFVRKQSQYVKSCYQFRLQRGETRTISDFIQDLDLEQMYWQRLCTEAEKFGLLDRLHLVEFDSYFKKHETFPHEHLPLGFNEPLELTRSNGSANTPALYAFMRLLNQEYADKYKGKKQEKLQVNASLIEQQMLTEQISLQTAIEQLFGKTKAIQDLIQQSKESAVDGVFPTVQINSEESKLLKTLELRDKKALSQQEKSYGDFSHWGN